MTQRLRPTVSVFHADVPSGSMWSRLPLRSGPTRNHRSAAEAFLTSLRRSRTRRPNVFRHKAKEVMSYEAWHIVVLT